MRSFYEFLVQRRCHSPWIRHWLIIISALQWVYSVIYICTSRLVGMRNIAISVSVCKLMSVTCDVCPLTYLKNHMSKLHEIFCHGNRGRSSVLLWWHCSMSCTSGFVDDVTFSRNGVDGVQSNTSARYCFVEFAKWRHRGEVAVYDCKFVVHGFKLIQEIWEHFSSWLKPRPHQQQCRSNMTSSSRKVPTRRSSNIALCRQFEILR